MTLDEIGIISACVGEELQAGKVVTFKTGRRRQVKVKERSAVRVLLGNDTLLAAWSCRILSLTGTGSACCMIVCM